MLKKYEKIIKRVCNPEYPKTLKVRMANGFYYATDMFRIVRFEDMIDDMPLYADNECPLDYDKYFNAAAGCEYDALEIPYTASQIKAWCKGEKQKTKCAKIPFKLGTFVKPNIIPRWIAINSDFLIDAMETTKSNIVHIPKKNSSMLLMQGNGFVWLIMPVILEGYESDKHMTEIEIKEN